MERTVDSCIYSGKSAPRIVDEEERGRGVEREEKKRKRREEKETVLIPYGLRSSLPSWWDGAGRGSPRSRVVR